MDAPSAGVPIPCDDHVMGGPPIPGASFRAPPSDQRLPYPRRPPAVAEQAGGLRKTLRCNDDLVEVK